MRTLDMTPLEMAVLVEMRQEQLRRLAKPRRPRRRWLSKP
jgi:hypothetical protein